MKTTDIGGDLALSRHLTVGGTAEIKGAMRVGHNLRIDGWLEAKNIKGPGMGLFPSLSALNAAYPEPRPGWWALVGNTLPAALYVASNGAWASTGESTGMPAIEFQTYSQALEQMQSELSTLQSDLSVATHQLSQVQALAEENHATATANVQDITALRTLVADIQGQIQSLQSTIAAVNVLAAETKGDVIDLRQDMLASWHRTIVEFEETAAEDGSSISIQPLNAAGMAVGNPIRIPQGTGSGAGGSATSTFSISLRDNPLYAAAGSEIATTAAIRSVTYEDGQPILNAIRSVSVMDAASGVRVYENTSPQASSTTLTDFSFDIQFNAAFSGAGSKDFVVQAKDDTGATRIKYITVTVVDATVQVSQVQTLHSASIQPGAQEQEMPMYRFPANASRQGIRARIEMLWHGQWRTLQEATITDTYTHTVRINPIDPFGDSGGSMQHGSYPLRIQGQDIATGVKGNAAITSLLCIDPAASAPAIALRCDSCVASDEYDLAARIYDSVRLEAALWTPSGSEPVQLSLVAACEGMQPAIIAQIQAHSGVTYSLDYQVRDVPQGIMSLQAFAEGIASLALTICVNGSAIESTLMEGAAFMHSIDEYTQTSLAEALRQRQDYTIDYQPFGIDAEDTGCAVQFTFTATEVADPNIPILQCLSASGGAGFSVTAASAAIYCSSGTSQLEQRALIAGERTTIAIVAEPATAAIERAGSRYSMLKLYINGEECACIGYPVGIGALASQARIHADGTGANVSLHSIMAYRSYFGWRQAIDQYLAVQSGLDLAQEWQREQVLDAQSRPSLALLSQMGLPYYVVVASQDTFDEFDSGTSTSDNFTCSLIYCDPQRPWRSFTASNVRWRRQGTTSAKRPVKNDRFYFAKSDRTTMQLSNPELEGEGALAARCLAANRCLQVAENGFPVDTITVKVDYSDSSGANDTGVCEMMNATFRALGGLYLTPAQRAFGGTVSVGDMQLAGIALDHSTKSHPIAAFRATEASLADVWFHAKGNWKEDKGEQRALGFRDIPGYNLGCLNYGDFTEYCGLPAEELEDTIARFMSSAASREERVRQRPVLLSQYCGRSYRIMRYDDSSGWQATTGSMAQDGQGRWMLAGDVLNPVIGYELLNYQGMCWWQGVESLDDMMEPLPERSAWVQKLIDSGAVSASLFPAWTYYFECLIDDEQLAVNYATGAKVPYELYRMLRFCQATKEPGSGQERWENELWKYASVQSLFAYAIFTDYLAAVDQRAKNMQPMWMLEDGESVSAGEYSSEQALRMYLNKIYDCDTCNGKDNDGGCTVLPDTDPNQASTAERPNPYAGWGSCLFGNIHRWQQVAADQYGTQLSLRTVAAAMRSAAITLPSGQEIRPFSPQGASKFFVEDRLLLWPKLVSSYDGEKKYIRSLPTSDSIYLYALQGLGLTALPNFITQRWRIRDGYYQTGDFFTGVLSGRVSAPAGAQIRITAGTAGYFAVGNDASRTVTECVYLAAGQEHAFTQFSHAEGALLYLYQADRILSLDISEITIDDTFDFSVMKAAQTLKLGCPGKTNLPIQSYRPLSAISLGTLPLLQELDITGTTALSLDISGCSRLATVRAADSQLSAFRGCEGGALAMLSLPGSIATLRLSGLSLLSIAGLQLQGLRQLHTLTVCDCPLLDIPALLQRALSESAPLRYLRAQVNCSAPISILLQLAATAVTGLAKNGSPIDEDYQCSGMCGIWKSDSPVDQTAVEQAQAYFPALQVHNLQYTGIRLEAIDDCANVTNMDTGSSGEDYAPTGYFESLLQKLTPVLGSADTSGTWVGQQLDRSNYALLADGTEADIADSAGAGTDAMLYWPPLWLKGVNDLKNGCQYIYLSLLESSPLSSAVRSEQIPLSESVIAADSAIYAAEADSESQATAAIADAPGYSVHAVDVRAMKQVRIPAVVGDYCAVFADDEGQILEIFQLNDATMPISERTDYAIARVPDNATALFFTASANCSSEIAFSLATDSEEPEAMEPKWSRYAEWLCGIYQASVDDSQRLRSVSNAEVVKSLTGAQFGISARQRGIGYQLIDYQMHKLIAIALLGLTGTRDIQAIGGRGKFCINSYVSGYVNSTGLDIALPLSGGSNTLGLESCYGVMNEWMDLCAMNVYSVADFIANGYEAASADATATDIPVFKYIDATTGQERSIALPLEETEKTVKQIILGQGCELLPTEWYDDLQDLGYADTMTSGSEPGIMPIRAGYGKRVGAGTFHLTMTQPGTQVYQNTTSRLAFRGPIRIGPSQAATPD